MSSPARGISDPGAPGTGPRRRAIGDPDARGATGLGARLGRALRRLTSSNDELASDEMLRAAQDAGAQPIRECRDRQKVVLSGAVSALTASCTGEHPRLSADLRDGSGTVRVVWIGRRSIPGVDSGRTIRVEGRVSCQDGGRVMYNPRYELLPD